MRSRRRAGPRRRRGAEQGAATAELAVALPSLVIVLAIALAAIDLGLAQVRCVDAARIGARLLARGEPELSVVGEVKAAAPEGAQVQVTSAGSRVSVVVTGSVPSALRPLGAVAAPSASAQAMVEATP